MKKDSVIFSKGINRSQDPRYIGNDEQYDALNLEVIRRGVLSKREGFGRYRGDGYDLFSADPNLEIIRGVALMYDSDGNRYFFVFYDGVGTGTDLWIEKAGGTPLTISNFFPSKGYRVRAAVFGDKIYFVNGQDRPRWYKEYDGAAHVWGIGGVPSPARRPTDETSYDFEVTRAQFAEHIIGSEGLGIDPPGIWRYKQTVGYFGKENTEQIEESNAGPASRLFACQFNTAEALGTTLEGYIKKGISIRIADHDDLILGSDDSQDYESFVRWMRLYRQHKMFSDELYSPFEHLVEMKKGWPIRIVDVYQRDSAVVAPTTRVSLPIAHHIEKANNRLFLGRIEKELFTQPALKMNFRGMWGYKPDFSYRMPITITNTNSKTLTGAIIPLRFHDDTDNDTDTTATPPSGGGTWRGAYILTGLDIETTDWYQMVFVDEDGVTPLGFLRVGVHTSGDDHDITFLVEIPEIAAGGTRTIYLYFEDSELTNNPESYSGQPGHWLSLAHYPFLSSDHLFLMDFENWESGMAYTAVTQKRSLGYLEAGPVGLGESVATISKSVQPYFFNDTTYSMGWSPHLNVEGNVVVPDRDCVQVKFYPPADTANVLSFVFLLSFAQTSGHSGSVRLANSADPESEVSILINFVDGAASTLDVTATAYYDGGNTSTGTINIAIDADERYYIAVVVTLTTLTLYILQGDFAGHPAKGAALSSAWDVTGFEQNSSSVAFTGPLKMYSTAEAFVTNGGDVDGAFKRFKEIQVLTREIDGFNELIAMWNHDTYWPNSGLATVGDREASTSADKYPDRFYFSDLNAPNSFDAINFRDLGNKGSPIQGIKGIRNRVFIFTPSDVRALFAGGSEQALPLGSGDTTMWNLSQDLTGEIGGLGVLAPDTLITMEFAGRDGVGFLSRRGFYFFDGQNFVHLSPKVDEILDGYSDGGVGSFSDGDLLRYMTAHFLKKKRQLILSPIDTSESEQGEQLVANLMFAQSPEDIIWTKWRCHVAFGVEHDFSIDDGAFVYACLVPAPTPYLQKQLLKLEANTGADIYKDKYYNTTANVGIIIYSKHYEVFDSELIKLDFVIDKASAAYDGYYLKVYEANVAGFVYGTELATITNPQNAMIFLPIGTHAKKFSFKLLETSASALILHGFTFYYNQHGERRLQGA